MNPEMHDGAGHLTALGWTSFALYMAAGLISLRSAGVARSHRLDALGQIWTWLAAVLVVLGLNKPINLQTSLIRLGRHFMNGENLDAYRMKLHALFFLGFLLTVVALIGLALFLGRAQLQRFGRELPLAAGGCALVGVYVLIRSVSITQVDQMLGMNFKHLPFLWLLEASGLMLIIIQGLYNARQNRDSEA